jgi:gluconokinase
MHYQNAYPEKAAKVAYFSSQQEYIFEKLTGEIAHSKSIASGSGFFNIHTLDWDDEILEFVSMKRAQLAELYEPTYYKPLKTSVAKELNLPSGIPVIIGSPDGGMNQVGSGAVKNDIMTFSVGTSAALRVAVEKHTLTKNPSTWCYYLGEGKRIAGASTAGAGNCLSWFVNNFPGMGQDAYAYFDGLLESVSMKDAPFFMPFLYGERCPGWQDRRLGGFNYLKADHGIKDLYYATLEGVLFNIFHCYEILADIYGIPGEIRISGGILKSACWTQMAADIFHREIVVCDFEHQSLMGASVMALKTLGQIQLLADYKPALGKKVSPNKDLADIYGERFQKYLAIYGQALAD